METQWQRVRDREHGDGSLHTIPGVGSHTREPGRGGSGQMWVSGNPTLAAGFSSVLLHAESQHTRCQPTVGGVAFAEGKHTLEGQRWFR